MNKSLDESLHCAVIVQNLDVVLRLLVKGANPNKSVRNGKTCLGEAASIGNIEILAILIDAINQKKTSSNPFKRLHYKPMKRKLKQDSNNCEIVVKQKNFAERLWAKFDKSKDYSIFKDESSSSDESKVATAKSPISPCTPSTLPGDLEWDEDIGAVAPTTAEDDAWSSTYIWYAQVLETTGLAICDATKVFDGIDGQDYFTKAALHYAAEKGHLAAAKLLIEAGCKVDITTKDCLTPLHLAVMHNHGPVAEALLAAGANINYQNHEKMTPLHYASSKGCTDIVKMLVEKGATVEARNTKERTPLSCAAHCGHHLVVEYLISVGANFNCDANGYTPLCEAVWQRNAKVVEVLLKHKPRITHTHRLLHHAVLQEEKTIVALLLTCPGIGVNLFNEYGETPLLCATRQAATDTVRLLLENGANVNLGNKISGASCVHIAVEHVPCGSDLERLLLLLLEHGADLNAVALTGDTPLNRALLLAKEDAATFLIRYGADVHRSDLYSLGLDNLSIAGRFRSPRLARLLVLAGHSFRPAALSPPGAPAARWVHKASRRPLRLADQCRIMLRNAARGRCLLSYVLQLPLPPTLKRFLMLEDE